MRRVPAVLIEQASNLTTKAFLMVAACVCLSPLACQRGGGNQQVESTRHAIEATHTLSGTVFGGGTALPGTLVEALVDGTTTVVASNTSGADGVYSIDLADATYDLRVTPPAGSGYDQQTVQNVVIAGADKRNDIVLIAQGGTVAGQVRGYGGVPMPGIYVSIYDHLNWTYVASMMTDSQGRYSFALGAGRFVFILSANGTPPEQAPNNYWYQYTYDLATTGATTIDFDLPVAKVSGTVADGAGAPVSGAAVTSNGYSWTPSPDRYNRYLSSATTDANGHYQVLVFTGADNTLTVLPPAPLAAQVHAGLSVTADVTHDFTVAATTVSGTVRGHAAVGLPGVVLEIVDRFSTDSNTVLSATTDSTGRYEMRLAPGSYAVKLSASSPLPAGAPNGDWYYYFDQQATEGTLDFNLPVARVQGIVTDSNGTALVGATVASQTYSWSFPFTYISTAPTDSSGQYALWVFTDPDATFTATAASLPQVVKNVVVAGDMTLDFVVPSTPISGQIRGYAGSGIANVLVEVHSYPDWATVLSTTTDAQGHYDLSLSPGVYSIRLYPMYPPSPAAPNSWYADLSGQTVGETFDYDLPVAKVEGVVMDSNGAPIPNVVIRSSGRVSQNDTYASGEGQATTDASGRYQLLVLKSTNTFTVTPPEGSGFSLTVISSVEVTGDFSQAIILESPDLSPPVIVAGPTVVHLSDTSVSIRWQTNEPADSRVDYGLWGLDTAVSSPSMVTMHEVTLVGLLPSTVYQYQVSSTDAAGNGPTQSAIFTFQTEAPPGDITPPVITAGPTVTSIGQTTALISWTTDEPASSVVQFGTTPSLGSEAGSTTTFTVEHQVALSDLLPNTTYTFVVASTDPDNNGPTNSAPATFTTLAVPDTQAPVILTGPEISDATDKTLTVIWTTDEAATSGVSYNDGTTFWVVSDTQLVTSHSVVLADLSPGTTYHITVSSKDTAGNGPTLGGPIDGTTKATANPVVTPPADMVVEATSAAGAVVTFTVSAQDAGGVPLTAICTPASGDTFPIAVTTVVCTATDSQGATGTASFKVTVKDTTAPTLTLPDPITVDADSSGTATVTFTVTATDAVSSPVTPVCTPASGTQFIVGTTTVNCTAKDAANNQGSGSFSVTVKKPNTPPVVTAPSDMIVEAAGPTGTIAVFAASANDAEDGALVPTCTPASGTLFPLGATAVTCTAVDSVGATGSATFLIAVVDTTSPSLVLPAPIAVDEDGSGGAVVNYTATASDAVSGTLTPICTPASGSRFTVGTTTVSCSAADGAGNRSEGSFTVAVRAVNKPPKITVPADMVVEATSASGATVSYTVSAQDPEEGLLSPECAPVSDSVFALGATTVSCTAEDSAGASVTAAFTITVVDTTAPVFTFVPSAVTISTCSAANIGQATASDAVGPVDVTNNAPAVFPDGQTVVTWTAKDGAGNVKTATQTVTGACLTCVFAGQDLQIKDRTRISGTSVGAKNLFLGVFARIGGDAKASGSVDMRDRSTIAGTLRVAGGLTRGSGTSIGTLIKPATVLPPTLASKTFPVGTGSVSIAPDATRTLAPGNYGKMIINSRAKVTLNAGTYNFASLDIESTAKLTLNTSAGPIIVNVQGALVFKGQITYVASSPSSVSWYSNGSINVEPQQLPAFPGRLIAPNGLLRIASQNTINGCIEGGKTVTIEPDNVINGLGM